MNSASNGFAESLLVHFRRAEELRREAVELPSVDLDGFQLILLELLLNRAFYPLQGFLCQADHESVLKTMRLASGAPWPLPVCLGLGHEEARALEPGARLALRDGEGFLLAVLHVEELWEPDPRAEAEALFGSADPARPGVAAFLDRARPVYVGGGIEGVSLPVHYDFRELRRGPSGTHRRFMENGWRRVLGVICQDYPHRPLRESVLDAARKASASVLLLAAAGHQDTGSLDHYTRVRCLQALATHFPGNMVMTGLLPWTPWHAGARETLLQALVLRNFGCTHVLVPFREEADGDASRGRGREDGGGARELIASLEEETGIIPVPWREMGYVPARGRFVVRDEAGPDEEVLGLDPAELRRRLELGLDIPDWFSYPEILEEMRRAHPPRSRQGFTIFLTGLSGSGKSTIARVLMVRFLEMRDRPVTLLDGDIVRKNLSSELSYSREHRNLNVTRIGFVASEITKNGGIALCAPIAPYRESRRKNRELISRYGGYIEVHVCTPLEVCEARDRKGLYARARAGIVPRVTGISDPYEPPENPELRIDTTDMSPMEAVQTVLLYLEQEGYIR